MAEIKPPTIRSVSAALRKAGFRKAVTQSGVRGAVTIAGFHAWTFGSEIRVTHWQVLRTGDGASVTPKEMLGKYAEALKSAGWWAVDTASRGYLVVSAPVPRRGDCDDRGGVDGRS